MLLGTKWDTLNLTFSFPTKASFYGAGYGSGEPGSAFEALNAQQKIAVRESFEMISSYTNLSFREIAESTTQHADLRHAMSDIPGTAWAYYPSNDASGGDSWYRNSSGGYDAPVLGNYAYFTFIHEIGHSLGLKHGHEGGIFGAMPAEHDSHEYSIMTYRSYLGSPGQYYTNETWGGPQSMMINDIAALQHMYGADYTTNAGDTTYSWSATTGEMSVNGVGQGTPGGNRIFRTVWDGGGTDTYDLSNYSGDVIIDLRPGEWTTTSQIQLANLGDGNYARGNIANAILFNDDTRSLIENAIGSSGNDVIFGNAGSNTLDGQDGSDIIVLAGLQSDYAFSGTADSLTATGFGVTDTILNAEFVRFLGSNLTVASADLFESNSEEDDYRDAIADQIAPLGSLNAGATVAGGIEVAGDRDVFAITLKASSNYTFELRGSPTNGGALGDGLLELWDSKGALLLSNDDFNSADAHIVFRAKTSGTYYLIAGGDGYDTGTYTLSAKRDFDDYADKISDTTAPLGQMSMGGSRMGAIEKSGDIDYFAVNLVAGKTYGFDLRGSPTDAGTLPNALLELRDGAGNLLLSNNDYGGTKDSHISYTASTSGTHYLAARGSGSNIGTYALSAAGPAGAVEDAGPSAWSTMAGGAHADYFLSV
ncbi:pre-peptidase C-terminal domain-containing protein [Roseomonas xinghualingensis]|uniref:pre-peptidase C-terminal domain-containing protein n=1 Tax=Roseomonas xinghualingensis TaxID=2986475 RepID=UPI0021F110F8|nr:M10 family metallopeptidase C-terminal domain-containing protein [Roseomonas sp. SXEYE001]MCV4206226.1 M10 family metallopeptidase C-terminal domain-containing protein [Roseomonas sp. SXEYE001]